MGFESSIPPRTRHVLICNTSSTGRHFWTSVLFCRPYGLCYFAGSSKSRSHPTLRVLTEVRAIMCPGRLRMLIVRSPVRISFGGGGTDLPSYYETFGGAVLSAAINKHFYTVLEKRGDGKIQIISADLRTVETWQDIARMDIRGSALEIPLAVLKEFGCDVSVNLFLASEIPPGTGLGSSACVCVNLTKMLATYNHISMSKYELAERAFHIARNVLGRPVGKQDEYASAFGGLNFISFHQDGTTQVEPLNLPAGLVRELQSSLLLFFTGASHNSWTILEEQEKSTRSMDTGMVEYLHEIRKLAQPMKDALHAGELSEFGRLLHEGWEIKKRLSSKISNVR